jgi:tRNA (cytidine32/uridine32-2'-O)-methyltransferase
MKTMGLTRLYLAGPAEFPHREATYRAVQAADVLDSAIVTTDMAEAVADCTLVIGTSARQRRIQLPQLHPRELGPLCAASARDEIAIVFGREDSGLNNEEMQRCNWQVHVPTSEAYTSMNLAAVVQVLCYELRMAALGSARPDEGVWDEPLASAEGMERFYDHLESTLTEIEFLKPSAPRQLMTRLRRLFNRIRLDQMELNILRGWLTATQKAARGERGSGGAEH